MEKFHGLHGFHNFKKNSVNWLSEIFYDLLPTFGYEIREEQIFTAFQMLKAFSQKEVLFSEAGLGTGKTFAYLTSSIIYARYSGKPVIIACGSEALVDQITQPDGDIAKLSKALQLSIDSKAALDLTNFICMRKILEALRNQTLNQKITSLIDWVKKTKTGIRSEVPFISNEVWEQVSWEQGLNCGQCAIKYRCPTSLSISYRKAKDLIVCSHDYFFQHIRTKESLQEEGNVPLLPPYSAVVFDEAHHVEESARRALGDSISLQLIKNTLPSFLYNGLREAVVRLIEVTEENSIKFFTYLNSSIKNDLKINSIKQSETLIKLSKIMHSNFKNLIEELTIEGSVNDYIETQDRSFTYKIGIEKLARIEKVLNSLLDPSVKQVIWMEKNGDELAIWVSPFNIKEIMEKEVFTGIPVIFTSATLASGTSFEYIKRSLGATGSTVSRVGSPYNYTAQCLVYIDEGEETSTFNEKISKIVELLKISNGRSLVLFRDFRSLMNFRSVSEAALQNEPWTLLWEGDAAPSFLINKFKEDITSVLFTASFWEGISIEGSSLSQCIIAELPFPQDPQDDPIMKKKQEQAINLGLDPYKSVVVPEMLLKLKQGTGRLIRNSSDRGVISCIASGFRGTFFEKEFYSTFPEGAPFTTSLSKIEDFFREK
ncbi:ATP-dependent DNA helicase [Paenibacillus cellulositrophicus]|uniref:ATP-dependent DNA helicase n=1 Tax=Paenibacillus cellulositrophicus TaxID=562959 RepID=UPI00203D9C22|nr:ATP-dependent DNA helicase [Paenibacillus cellulositrophicus]MCM2996933.1 ATP-dependent DNA helicase [Paenibacillus cellulositrophicus]